MADIDTNVIHTGDCLDVLGDLPPESIHACVTDPPYGLAFMGRDWDDFDPKEYQLFCENWATELKRVLKPGAHLLAFSGNRTHHRLFSGVEDAGFEIRDTVTWHYGSGFPKALDVSKAIDKAAGESRKELAQTLKESRKEKGLSRKDVAEKIDCSESSVRDWEEGRRRSADDDGVEWIFPERERHERLADLFEGYPSPKELERNDAGADRRDDGTVIGLGHTGEQKEYTDATDAAKRWDGFKTALKPATEFVVVARKPFDGTVAENVQEHGTGALNIDGTRIGSKTIKTHGSRSGGMMEDSDDASGMFDATDYDGDEHEGRYPANVVFGERAAGALDSEVGRSESNIRTATGKEKMNEGGTSAMREMPTPDTVDRGYNDEGGPSRYFYTSKATKAERTLDGRIDNAHPTVKPGDLMEWLVKLVTADGQVVIDPFAGSGTTLRAAKDLDRQFVGIERDPEWADVARVRTGLTPDDPATVRGDDDQQGLEQF